MKKNQEQGSASSARAQASPDTMHTDEEIEQERERQRQRAAEPEPQDKLSTEWRWWKISQITTAFENGTTDREAYARAWDEFKALLYGLLADEDFWRISFALALLPQLLIARQEIDRLDLDDEPPTEPAAANPAPAEDDEQTDDERESMADFALRHLTVPTGTKAARLVRQVIETANTDEASSALIDLIALLNAGASGEQATARFYAHLFALLYQPEAEQVLARLSASAKAEQAAPTEAEDGDEDARPTSYDQPITPERAREIISEFRHHDLDDKVFAAIIALACGIAYENDRVDRDGLATEVVNAVYGHTYEGDDAASRFADRAAGMRFGEAARREEGGAESHG